MLGYCPLKYRIEHLVVVPSLDDHMKNILLELVLCQKVGAALLLEKKLQKQFCMFKFTDKFEKNATVLYLENSHN